MDDTTSRLSGENEPPKSPDAPEQGAPAAETPVDSWDGPVVTPPREKLPTMWGYFALGFLTPLAASALGFFVPYLVSSISQSVASVVVIPFMAVGPLVLVVMLLLFLKGRNTGNAKLASYGKGGLWAYALYALLLLLLFGTCLMGGFTA